MRCDGVPVRPEMRTTRQMSRASQPDKQNGTLSVHTIKASGHVHRSNRPNTRLHPTTTPHHQINPCNAGAIHTGHCAAPESASFAAPVSAWPKTASHVRYLMRGFSGLNYPISTGRANGPEQNPPDNYHDGTWAESCLGAGSRTDQCVASIASIVGTGRDLNSWAPENTCGGSHRSWP